MNKRCPNCGKEMPEEAFFCLSCFTENIGITDDFDDLKAVVPIDSVAIPAKGKRLKILYLKPSVIRSIAGTLAAIIVLLIFAQSFKKMPRAIESEFVADDGIAQSDDANTDYNNVTSPSKIGLLDNILDTVFGKGDKPTEDESESVTSEYAGTTASQTTLPADNSDSTTAPDTTK